MILISTLIKEGPFLASKWNKQIAFLDPTELKELFSHLSPFSIHPLGKVVEKEQSEISLEAFIDSYTGLIDRLKIQGFLQKEDFKAFDAFAISCKKDAFYLLEIKNGYLIKPRAPHIMIRPHFFDYSDRFRSGVLGLNSLFWGLEFSFPHIFQDPKTKKIEKVSVLSENSILFTKIRKYLRKISNSTTFTVGDKKYPVAYRLGKKCFPLIKNYTKLHNRDIHVESFL